MAKDPSEYEYEISELKKKLNLMSDAVKSAEERCNGMQAENDLLSRKLEAAVKDAGNARTIMTNNITQSNGRIQSLLDENQKLRAKIKELQPA